jgi:hypothetical protein
VNAYILDGVVHVNMIRWKMISHLLFNFRLQIFVCDGEVARKRKIPVSFIREILHCVG